MTRTAVTASAPAKVILFGEHFVVYGEPAVAVAIDKRAYTTAQLRRDNQIHVESVNLGVSGTFKGKRFQPRKGGAKAGLKLELIKQAVQKVLEKANKKSGINVMVDSSIPVSAGLGSSAAVATSVIAATGNLLGLELSHDDIFRMAYESERLVHGTPSGIDPAISTYGGALQFQRGKDFVQLGIKANIPLVIGNTNVQRSTGDLVASVRRTRDRYPFIIDSIIKTGGKLASEAVEALRHDDLTVLGGLMNINHALLCAVGVSHESLDRLVYAARNGGALGAKLTGGGGGGGGGCVIAVAERARLKTVARAIEHAEGTAFMARKTDEGVKVESER